LLVDQDIFPKKRKEQPPWRVVSGQGVLTKTRDISAFKVLPILDRYFDYITGRGFGRGKIAATPFLHIQICLAERIRPRPEFIAGESVTVPWAIVDTIVRGTRKDGAWGAQYPLLCGNLLLCLLALTRSACGTDSKEIQSANVAVYSAGSGGH